MWKGDTGTRDIHVALIKNRQGEEFETTLEFYASSMQFYDQGKSAQETQNYLGDTDGILPFDL
jgi:hypothetical protein